MKLEKIFKRSKNKQKQQVSNWVSDIANSSNIDEQKINFVYENGIDYLKELELGMQTLNTRTTLLLTYLAAIIAFSVNFALKTNICLLKIDALFIVAEYVALVFYITLRLLTPSLGYAVKNEPRNLLIEGVMKFDLKKIKFSECENIQNRIKFNSDRQQNLLGHLKWAIGLTFSLPIISSIFLLVYHLSL